MGDRRDADVDWDDGRVVTISAGTTARCRSLGSNQLYAILLYNTTQSDQDALVTVVWSNEVPPATVTVPGTTGNAGLANFVFVSGRDTDAVAVSLSSSAGVQTVTAFIVSPAMPSDPSGLVDRQLPDDGQFHSFEKCVRYWAIPPTGWSRVSIRNPSFQFVCLQATEASAEIVVVNRAGGLDPRRVCRLGQTANATGVVTVKDVRGQVFEQAIKGTGDTWVWMNGDSAADSTVAEISLHGLSAVHALLARTGLTRLYSALVQRRRR